MNLRNTDMPVDLGARIAAERGIAAQALKKDFGNHLTKIVEARLAPELFKDEYARQVFLAHARGVDLHNDEQLSIAGLIKPDYLELTDDTIGHSRQFARNLETVKSSQWQDRRANLAKRLIQGEDPAQIAVEIAALDSASSERPTLWEQLESRRIYSASQLPEPDIRLYLAGKPIATTGNLVTVIARAKVGKTATISEIVAAAIAAAIKNIGRDALGFTASDHAGMAVVCFDTEQSKYDARSCVARTLQRAGTEAQPDWLRVYVLAGSPADFIRSLFRPALRFSAEQCGGIFCAVLDGVADLVCDVNDPKECNALVAELHGLAIEFNCPIICVIHSNEGQKAGDDGRGHLGKQLTRKAESNLLLKKIGDVTTITSEKQRKAPITKADGIAFQWDESQQRHVFCAPSGESKESQKRAELRELASRAFGSEETLRWGSLKKRIAEMGKGKGNTPGRYITRMQEMGVIRKTKEDLYERVSSFHPQAPSDPQKYRNEGVYSQLPSAYI